MMNNNKRSDAQQQQEEEEYDQPSRQKVDKVRIVLQILSQCGVWMADEAVDALFHSVMAAVPKDIQLEWHVAPWLADEEVMSDLTGEAATTTTPQSAPPHK